MQNLTTSDDALVAAMGGGQEAALEQIIDRYAPYVGTIVRNIAGRRLDASDVNEIVSDVFYLAWCAADKIQPGKLKGYLSILARRRALNALRGLRLHGALEGDWIQIPCPGPEDDLIRQAEYAALRQTLNKLPEPDRTIFLRHYFLYQKTAEIASTMGIPVSTVKSKLRRGRQSLRRKLTEGGYFIDETNQRNL